LDRSCWSGERWLMSGAYMGVASGERLLRWFFGKTFQVLHVPLGIERLLVLEDVVDFHTDGLGDVDLRVFL